MPVFAMLGDIRLDPELVFVLPDLLTGLEAN